MPSRKIKFYQGELIDDPRSKSEIKKLKICKYELRTKPVKIMKHSIDASSVSSQSPDLLKHFIRRALLRKYDIETVRINITLVEVIITIKRINR